MTIQREVPPAAKTGGPIIKVDFSANPEMAHPFRDWIASGDYLMPFADWCTRNDIVE